MGALLKTTKNSKNTLIVKEFEGGNNHYLFWCPGCKEVHFFNVGGTGVKWGFNGDIENPTFTPSLRYLTSEGGTHCHLNLTNSEIEFHGDCPHQLKGQKRILEPFPKGVEGYI